MNRKLAVVILLFLGLVSCIRMAAPISTLATDFPTITPTHPYVHMPSIGDGGLFSGKPCASPCFFGIRIDETPSEQVTSILEKYNISPCNKYEKTNITCAIGYYANVWVTVDSSTSIVNSIGYDPSIPVSIADIIEKYGNANYVWVDAEGVPEATTLSLRIYWDSIKMEVDLPIIDDNGEHVYFIDTSTKVSWIAFYSDTNYSNPSFKSNAQPWKGYGAYQP